MMKCPNCGSDKTECGYGLAGGGGIGFYMYCETCNHIWEKTSDKELEENEKDKA